MEAEMGHTTNNVITVLMKERNLGLQGAVDHVAAQFSRLVNIFLDGKAHLPSWGAVVDARVTEYVKAMESWVSGNLHWSLEVERYFGTETDEVRRTRVVRLR